MLTNVEGGHPRTIWTKFYFIPPSSSEEEDFQKFSFFNPSEVMVVILENGQGHPT
jgi:hypothetical protein